MDIRVQQTQEWVNSTYGNLPGYSRVNEDGITGQGTFKALIWALQHEIGIVNKDGVFGNTTINTMKNIYPTLSEATNPDQTTPSNIIFILQGSLWCKGISPGGFTGIFGPATANAIYKFQVAAGIETDKIVRPYIMQGIMNTDGYTFRSTEDINDTYRHSVQMGLNKYYGERIGLIAPNGIWERKSQANLIKAVQIEWNASVDGKWGDGTLSKAPTISKNTSGYTNSKRILQWALTINGFYAGEADGIWGTATYNALYQFQDFLCLGADGICGKKSWASLMSSKGDKNRNANALDTSKQITEANAILLYQNGYRDVGRYLANTHGSSFDKKLYQNELNILKAAGLNVFPIYQTSGGQASYFNAYQGIVDAYRAIKYAKSFGFPPSATIYFAIDYDVLIKDIESNIMPYFRSINHITGTIFKIGVYGPRLICTKLYQAGLTSTSFVSDMSTGFTCNIGQKMPDNWAYDQFTEIADEDSEYSGNMGYDKIIASLRKTATAPNEFIEYTDVNYPEAEVNFNKIKKLYEYARNYLHYSVGSEDTIIETNRVVLRYLRQIGPYSNLAWNEISGTVDEAFNGYVENLSREEGIDLSPGSISIYDEFSNSAIEISHYAATLGSYLYPYLLDNYIDAFAGWAGDLAQVGGVIGKSIDLGGNNYFNLEDLKKCIGYMDSELSNYVFKHANDDGSIGESTDSGFQYQDLIQDVDSFNLYKGYDFGTTPLYTILEDYYVVNKGYKRRFLLFEQNLKEEFDKGSIEEVAIMFTKPNNLALQALNGVFSFMFGSYEYDTYGGVIAQDFAEKIQYYIKMYNNLQQ